MSAAEAFLLGAMMEANARRYIPIFHGKRRSPGVWDSSTGLYHERPQYTDIELGSLCRWLNKRAKEYPVEIVLTED